MLESEPEFGVPVLNTRNSLECGDCSRFHFSSNQTKVRGRKRLLPTCDLSYGERLKQSLLDP